MKFLCGWFAWKWFLSSWGTRSNQPSTRVFKEFYHLSQTYNTLHVLMQVEWNSHTDWPSVYSRYAARLMFILSWIWTIIMRFPSTWALFWLVQALMIFDLPTFPKCTTNQKSLVIGSRGVIIQKDAREKLVWVPVGHHSWGPMFCEKCDFRWR